MADLEQQLAKRRAINHARQGGKWYSVTRKRKPRLPGQTDRTTTVLEYLADHGPSIYFDIRVGTGIDSNSIAPLMDKLRAAGKIVRSGQPRRYLYALPSDGVVEQSAHPERIAPPSYGHQRVRDELAEIDRLIAARQK
jgi:hypothetical protein